MRLVRKAGFTVAEVFMVITLLAVVAGLMVVPVQRIVESLQTRPLEEVVLSAVREAHAQARIRNVAVVLGHPAESNLLQLHARDGTLLREIEIDAPAATGPGAKLITFYPILPEDPEREDPAYESAEDEVEAVVFHPSGASMPFCVEFGEGKGRVRLVVDPFSSAPVVREDEETRI